MTFQSRYRAAFHFRYSGRLSSRTIGICFNLVIERLFISGTDVHPSAAAVHPKFQSRYRAAFHFRLASRNSQSRYLTGFNLVIERLFISGCKVSPSAVTMSVSISLSSGFSFQVSVPRAGIGVAFRWFQSRYRAAFHFRRIAITYEYVVWKCFNLVIERLFISGTLGGWR